MKDFLDQLDDRLQALAVLETTPADTTRPKKARRRRGAWLGAITATLAAGAAAFTMTGTSLADLPILDTPTTDASGIRQAVPAVADRGVDFSKAHSFGTPGGPGYVLVTPETDTVCIVVPDAEAPGTYGSSCGTPLERVEREGLFVEMVGDQGQNPDATNLVAFVMPDGAEDVRLRTEGRTTEPELQSGVLVEELRKEGVLSWTVDGKPFRRLVEGPFPAGGGVTYSCPDGRARPGKEISPDLTTPEEIRAASRKAMKEACAR